MERSNAERPDNTPNDPVDPLRYAPGFHFFVQNFPAKGARPLRLQYHNIFLDSKIKILYNHIAATVFPNE